MSSTEEAYKGWVERQKGLETREIYFKRQM